MSAVLARDPARRPAWATSAIVIDGALLLAFTAFAPFGRYPNGFVSVLPTVVVFALIGAALVLWGLRPRRCTSAGRVWTALYLGIVTLGALAGVAASALSAPVLAAILLVFAASNAAGLQASLRSEVAPSVFTEARRRARHLRFAGARQGWPQQVTTTLRFDPPAPRPAARALAFVAFFVSLGTVFLRLLRSNGPLIAMGVSAALGLLIAFWVRATTELRRHGEIVVADDAVGITRLVRPLIVPRDAVTGIATAFVRPQGGYYSRSQPRRTLVLLGPGGIGLACTSAAMFSDDTVQLLADALNVQWDRQWPVMQAADLDVRFPGAATFTLRHPWLVVWLVLLAILVPLVLLLTVLGPAGTHGGR